MKAQLLPASLAIIAGTTDVTTWLLLGGLFSAHITGNIVVVSADLVSRTAPHAAQVLAIPAFIVITILATLLATALGRDRHRTEIALIALQTALLVAAWALGLTTTASADPYGAFALLIGLCAVSAMAFQNSFLHLCLNRPVSTAVMTGNTVAATIALVDMTLQRGHVDPGVRTMWWSTWPLVVGFILGCFLGALSVAGLSNAAAVVPAALSAALLVWRALTPGSPLTATASA
jgi:uncharacterized membrane protein YoaK (UPF0700 family)